MIKRNGDGKWTFDLGMFIQTVLVVGTIVVGFFTYIAPIRETLAVHDSEIKQLQGNVEKLEILHPREK